MPFGQFREIEDDQVFWCGRWRYGVCTAVGELEVIARPRPSKHDTIEPRVVLESSEFVEAEAISVHHYRSLQIADRASNA